MSATPGSGQWQTQAAGYAVPPNMQQQQWRWDQGTWGNQGQYNYANMAIGAVGQQLRPQYPQIPVTGSYPAGQAYEAVQNYQTTTAGAVWTADGFQSGQNVGFSGEAQGNAEEKQPPPTEENATKVNGKDAEAGENAEQPKEEPRSQRDLDREEENMSHPHKEAFAGYEKQWQEWRMQLLQRRDQMQCLKAEQQAAEAATSVATPVSNESSEIFQKSDQVTSSKEQTPTSQADTSQPSVENAATPSNGSQPDISSGQQIPGLYHLQEDQISASQPTSLITTLLATDPSSQGPPIFPDQSKFFFQNQFPMMQPQTVPLPPHLLQHQFPPPRQPPPPPAVHLRKDRNEPAKALLPDPPGYKMSQDQKRPLLSTPPPVGQGPMPRGASAWLLPLPPPGSKIGATPSRTPTPSDFEFIVEGSQEQQFAQQLPLTQNKDERFKLDQMRKDVSKEEETRFQKAAEFLQSNADAFGNREPYMSQVGIEESQDNMRDNWNFGGDRGRGIDRDHIRSRGRGRGQGRGTRWSDDTDDDEGRRSFGVGLDNMLPRDESGDKRREVFGEKTGQSSGVEERFGCDLMSHRGQQQYIGTSNSKETLAENDIHDTELPTDYLAETENKQNIENMLQEILESLRSDDNFNTVVSVFWNEIKKMRCQFIGKRPELVSAAMYYLYCKYFSDQRSLKDISSVHHVSPNNIFKLSEVLRKKLKLKKMTDPSDYMNVWGSRLPITADQLELAKELGRRIVNCPKFDRHTPITVSAVCLHFAAEAIDVEEICHVCGVGISTLTTVSQELGAYIKLLIDIITVGYAFAGEKLTNVFEKKSIY